MKWTDALQPLPVFLHHSSRYIVWFNEVGSKWEFAVKSSNDIVLLAIIILHNKMKSNVSLNDSLKEQLAKKNSCDKLIGGQRYFRKKITTDASNISPHSFPVIEAISF